MDIASLPLDVWIPICGFLSVQDILALRNSCKMLYEITNNRFIWYKVLVDILAIIWLPGVLQALPSMSCHQLRRKAIWISRLDRWWYQELLMPTKIQRHHCATDVIRAQFIQGGEWILILFSDGSIGLFEKNDLEKPKVEVPYSSTMDNFFAMGISFSQRLGSLAHVTRQGWNSGFSNIRIYQIDALIPTIRLLKEITIPQIIEPISLECELLAIPWMEMITGRLNIHMVGILDEEADKAVLMDLGIRDEESHNFTIQILSRKLLLLARSTELFLFAIPELQPVDKNGNPREVSVQTLWTYTHHVEPVRGRPSIGSVTHQNPTGHPYATVMLTGQFVYLMFPSEYPEYCHVEHYSLTGDIRYVPFHTSMGSRHAIWTNDEYVGPFVGFHSCAYFTMPKNCDGLQRLGHVEQLGIQVRPLQLPIRDEIIKDISWDEESGQVCIVISQVTGTPKKCILVVDMV